MERKNLPDKAEELLTEVLTKDPLVLASISAVPYFGSTLATFFSAKWLQIYQERTNALFERFRDYLNSLDERAIRRDYFDTPEGIDLLMKATEQSAKTRSEEKRDLIARILAGAASTECEQGEYSPEEYLNLIAALTVKELDVARTIYRIQLGQNYMNTDVGDKWKAWEAQRREIARIHALDPGDLTLMFDRIASTGLIELSYVLFPSTPRRTYWVTLAFDRLMGFLRLDA
jgi:hypothetical protein